MLDQPIRWPVGKGPDQTNQTARDCGPSDYGDVMSSTSADYRRFSPAGGLGGGTSRSASRRRPLTALVALVASRRACRLMSSRILNGVGGGGGGGAPAASQFFMPFSLLGPWPTAAFRTIDVCTSSHGFGESKFGRLEPCPDEPFVLGDHSYVDRAADRFHNIRCDRPSALPEPCSGNARATDA